MVFQRTKDDDKVALSIEDDCFLDIMKKEFQKDENNGWVAPLPFKNPRQRLPDNKMQAMKRLSSLLRNFKRKPQMREHFVSFMEKVFENGHAEVAPPLKDEEERWYLPIFGVYHPKKPGQIRVVIDSSAQYSGVSLNDVLLTGPDLNNSLLGVFLRFRKESVAITADIQQMFYCFLVKEEDRNFLRFLWFRDNDPSKDIVEYRMKVHVFGNSPSPAIAIYGLRKAAHLEGKEQDSEVQQFVERDFYVDDGLKSLPTVEAAVSLLKRTQTILARSNVRLHKIASNKREVMEAFPSQDYASDLKDLDLEKDNLPIQRSLGLNWDLKMDCFVFEVPDAGKPLTRRGVLSTINSLFDPLGFAAPVTINGKFILRDLTLGSIEWDSPLPQDTEDAWVAWRNSLQELRHLQIPRTYSEQSPSVAAYRELCVFSDASTKAITAVAYLKLSYPERGNRVSFVMGKVKLAPLPEHTIPRLELCAAVLAVEVADLISSEMDMDLDAITFYTDSKVVLGYIHNRTRRFYVYVNNRVLRIRRSSQPEQWCYVRSDQNPADIATRSVSAECLANSPWLMGPRFLADSPSPPEQETFELVNPALDVDVRPKVTNMSTTTVSKKLGSQRFSRFSSWQSLIRSIGRLIHIANAFHKPATNESSCPRSWHYCPAACSAENFSKAKTVILQAVQEETYATEIACIKSGKNLPKTSPLISLNPFIDNQGLLRVGGRISAAKLDQDEKNPLIIPGKHHVGALLVRHYHHQTQHQGRLLTEGAVRAAGLWVIGGKRLVNNILYHCVLCRKLRGHLQTQKMASLPADRMCTDPPFTNIGLDVFGPWSIHARRTRGGLAHDKRWAVIFTCLSVRAVHIEVIESLDTSSFINALRRFFALRGPVKEIRSDRGTNFIGACKELQIPSNIDEKSVQKYLAEHGCSWVFNPPHASHMGGSWERMIGMARKILDSMFLQLGHMKLTHEVLTTFMAEVTAIINARPLVPVSTDPSDPFLLTPSILLTQKVGTATAPAGDFGTKDLFQRQWRQVQHLANTFWDKWRKQYLCLLQTRRKWQSEQPDVEPGSIVLLKDSQTKRNEWPLGIITQVFPSKDGKVRKVEIRIPKQDGTRLFLRPVTEIVVLLPPESKLK
ncbi:hypothetical protein M9458_050984 [Cirrhinus mrigala]|uniref:Integrase catalytic domain-containing protein n=1 Tax=Cirrhinus mrigala TaxID=683832 RepID=A0ABD0MYQ0_CIRMR